LLNKIICQSGLCLILVVFLLTSCTSTINPLNISDPEITVVWPKAPEKPRIKLLRSLSGPEDLLDRKVQKNRLFRWLTGEMTEPMPLVSPYGIATDGDGTLWIADPGAHAVHVLDLKKRKSQLWMLAGNESFGSPVSIAFDASNQKIYVADTTLNKIVVLSMDGDLISYIAPEEPFGRPGGIALGLQGDLFVADVLKGVIRHFSVSGHELPALGSPTTPSGLFNRPIGLAVDVQGLIYVIDSLNFRIEVITQTGEAVSSIGELGDQPGNLSRPRGVAVDGSGHIYVSDAAFDNIQIFNLKGELLLVFGGDGKFRLSLPAELASDLENRIYAVDSFNRQIKIYQYLDPSD